MTTDPAAGWVAVPVTRPDADLRLVCLPHAGGGTATFVGLARNVPEWIELVVVRMPGRESRLAEEPRRDAAPLADELAAALRPLFDRPYAIFGHSLGAVLGFELVHRLHDNGAPAPSHLFVSGRRAPQLPDPDPPIAALPDEAFLAELQRRYGAIPAAVLAERDLLALLLPALRADLELLERYEYEERGPLPCPISALGGDADGRARPRELDAWSVHTSRGFKRRLLPGGHFYFQGAEPLVAEIVTADLSARALIPGGSP